MSMSAKSSANDIGSQGSSDPYFDAFGCDSGLDTIKVSFMCITVPIMMRERFQEKMSVLFVFGPREAHVSGFLGAKRMKGWRVPGSVTGVATVHNEICKYIY